MKTKLNQAFGDRKTATVVEVLAHEDEDIRAYAEYLFANDYAPYTAKQWGVSSSEIDPSVLKRVPLRFEKIVFRMLLSLPILRKRVILVLRSIKTTVAVW